MGAADYAEVTGVPQAAPPEIDGLAGDFPLCLVYGAF